MAKEKKEPSVADLVLEAARAVADAVAPPAPPPAPAATPKPPRAAPRPRGRWVPVTGPKVWRTEEGDEIIGSYMGVKTCYGAHGSYDTAVVHTDDGTRWLVAGVVALQALAGVPHGVRVMVRYLGMEMPEDPSRNTYRNYAVCQWVPA